MKKTVLVLLITGLLATGEAAAQCSICTKTAQQLGEGPASGMNTGILYIALIPLILGIGTGYYWWKKNGHSG